MPTGIEAARIDAGRLVDRISALAEIGAIPGGGCARLALTDEDRLGRDLVVSWMRDLGLEIDIDVVGNVVGTWNVGSGAPVMTGSHIDTVKTGGRYDGNLGVLAGLEVIQTLQEIGFTPARPIAVAFFTNEEGARFAPDMMGSLAFVGGVPVEEVLDTVGIDGRSVGEELERIGYSGPVPCPRHPPHSFVELHIEQGPVLEESGVRIGAVTGVQGISWQEVTISGQSNHAGTTPMRLRRDPGVVAARVAVFMREIAEREGGNQVCTVGRIEMMPNLINVVPASVVMTLDIRNTDESILRRVEDEVTSFLGSVAESEGCSVVRRTLARFEPVDFDPAMIDLVESTAERRGNTVARMPSGAGHDAQMLARVCPASMIFVPSTKGISHNPAEHTDPDDLEAGCNVLLEVIARLALEGGDA